MQTTILDPSLTQTLAAAQADIGRISEIDRKSVV